MLVSHWPRLLRATNYGRWCWFLVVLVVTSFKPSFTCLLLTAEPACTFVMACQNNLSMTSQLEDGSWQFCGCPWRISRRLTSNERHANWSAFSNDASLHTTGNPTVEPRRLYACWSELMFRTPSWTESQKKNVSLFTLRSPQRIK